MRLAKSAPSSNVEPNRPAIGASTRRARPMLIVHPTIPPSSSASNMYQVSRLPTSAPSSSCAQGRGLSPRGQAPYRGGRGESEMFANRRTVLKAAATLPLLATPGLLRAAEPDLSELTNIAADAKPIGIEERRARIARAQALMKANGIGAVLIEPGSSLIYFTGIRWGRSERLTGVILPVEGDPCVVTPFFEEPRTRETLAVPADVRVWQEDEDPLKIVAGFLRDRKLARRPVGIEETVRYFAVDGLARALPGAKLVSANPVVRGCRMIKTAPEIALMQCATDVTIAAYRWVHPRIEAGMSQRDVAALMDAATAKLCGDPEFSLVLIGEVAAYPHGTKTPQPVTAGRIVLMDCGCTVQGYQSDVSRTFAHGTATAQPRKGGDPRAHG